MTQPKSMNLVIHAAFRRDLKRFDAAFKTFPAGSRERADQLTAAWANFEHQLHHHHQDEETIFWPVLRGLGEDPALDAELSGEHQSMVAALDAASASMRTFHADPNAVNVDAAQASVASLSNVLLAHLEHEERDLEPLSVANEETPQMKQAKVDVRKAHKGGMGMFIAWLQDGATPEDIAGLKHEIPPPVVFVITMTAGRKYAKTVAPAWAA